MFFLVIFDDISLSNGWGGAVVVITRLREHKTVVIINFGIPHR
jgi:hypothetical protein